MNIKINTVDDLIENMGLLPVAAKLDINKRICDWIGVPGNTEEDLYIKNQFKYAECLINK